MLTTIISSVVGALIWINSEYVNTYEFDTYQEQSKTMSRLHAENATRVMIDMQRDLKEDQLERIKRSRQDDPEDVELEMRELKLERDLMRLDRQTELLDDLSVE